MIKKPDTCRGCPFFGDGQGFVPDTLNNQSDLLIFAQNPGEFEEQGKQVTGYQYGNPVTTPHPPSPLIGPTGYMLNREYLPLTGQESVSLGNAIRCRWHHTNDLPPLSNTSIREAIKHCHKAHFKLPEQTRLIVAMGEYAMYALSGVGLEKNHKVGDWRGFLLPFDPLGESSLANTPYIWTPKKQLPVLVSYHLAYLFRDPSAAILARRDWSKVPRILAGKWPQVLPAIITQPFMSLPSTFAFDTEYVPDTGKLIRYSAANDNTLRVVEAAAHLPPIAPGRPKLITHNAIADIGHFESLMALAENDYDLEDTMYQHALLWSDLGHDLNTLGSVYARTNRWKHLEHVNPIEYSAGDALGTWDAYNSLDAEMQRDPQTLRVYRDIQLKLIPIIRRARAAGIQVHRVNADEIARQLKTTVDELQIKAEAITGWPINLASGQQTAVQLYQVEQLKTFAFLTGKRDKKHGSNTRLTA